MNKISDFTKKRTPFSQVFMDEFLAPSIGLLSFPHPEFSVYIQHVIFYRLHDE
ncbi:hypothetical protein [Chlorobaculum tepidum]|uniref:hypothetical protein n=1 Tax=Chlorobaculum tepidum TaxID=1097 RepID=UPI0002EDDD73|nr:hypothetical protein [Chlorobaculum tepidum]